MSTPRLPQIRSPRTQATSVSDLGPKKKSSRLSTTTTTTTTTTTSKVGTRGSAPAQDDAAVEKPVVGWESQGRPTGNQRRANTSPPECSIAGGGGLPYATPPQQLPKNSQCISPVLMSLQPSDETLAALEKLDSEELGPCPVTVTKIETSSSSAVVSTSKSHKELTAEEKLDKVAKLLEQATVRSTTERNSKRPTIEKNPFTIRLGAEYHLEADNRRQIMSNGQPVPQGNVRLSWGEDETTVKLHQAQVPVRGSLCHLHALWLRQRQSPTTQDTGCSVVCHLGKFNNDVLTEIFLWLLVPVNLVKPREAAPQRTVKRSPQKKKNRSTGDTIDDPLFGFRILGSPNLLQWYVGQERNTKWQGEDTSTFRERPLLQLMEGIFLDDWKDTKKALCSSSDLAVADVNLSRHLGLILVLNGEPLTHAEWKVSQSPWASSACAHRLEVKNYEQRLVLADFQGHSSSRGFAKHAKFGPAPEWASMDAKRAVEKRKVDSHGNRSKKNKNGGTGGWDADDDGIEGKQNYNKRLLSLTKVFAQEGNPVDILTTPCFHPIAQCGWGPQVKDPETYNDWSDNEPVTSTGYFSCQLCDKKLIKQTIWIYPDNKRPAFTSCGDLRWCERNQYNPDVIKLDWNA